MTHLVVFLGVLLALRRALTKRIASTSPCIRPNSFSVIFQSASGIGSSPRPSTPGFSGQPQFFAYEPRILIPTGQYVDRRVLWLGRTGGPVTALCPLAQRVRSPPLVVLRRPSFPIATFTNPCSSLCLTYFSIANFVRIDP